VDIFQSGMIEFQMLSIFRRWISSRAVLRKDVGGRHVRD